MVQPSRLLISAFCGAIAELLCTEPGHCLWRCGTAGTAAMARHGAGRRSRAGLWLLAEQDPGFSAQAFRSVMAIRQGVSPGNFPDPIAVLFAIQIAIRLGSELNHDTAWYLYVAQGLLNGGELYRDFVEVNPPLAIWLTVPVVMLSRATGLAPIETLYGVFFAMTAMSLLLAWRYLAMIRGVPDWTGSSFCSCSPRHFCLFQVLAFGQREHLLVLLFMPWFVLRFARSQGAQISVAESAFVGLLGAVAICMKPHAVLAPLAVEALLLLRGRNLRAVFAPENLAAAVFAAALRRGNCNLEPAFPERDGALRRCRLYSLLRT